MLWRSCYDTEAAARYTRRDATLAIQELARETGANVQELQTLYAVFDVDSITASAIRDGNVNEYAGVRVRLVGLFGRATDTAHRRSVGQGSHVILPCADSRVPRLSNSASGSTWAYRCGGALWASPSSLSPDAPVW